MINTLRFLPRSVTICKPIYGIVYLARNKVNGHGYVGQSTNFEDRKIGHFYDSRWCDYPFHRAIRRYEWCSFEWILLGSAQTQKELDDQEIKYINLYGYYNIRGGGGHGKLPEAIKEKIRTGVMAINTPEWRDKISVGVKNSYTAKLRAIRSSARLGIPQGPMLEASKEKLRVANLGKKYPEKNIGERRAAHLGKKHSEASKAKMRAQKLGKKHTEQHKAKNRAARLGIPRGPYTKAIKIRI